MSNNLIQKTMEVFPSLSFDKARFLIETFGEENTQQVIQDVKQKRENQKALEKQLNKKIHMLKTYSNHSNKVLN